MPRVIKSAQVVASAQVAIINGAQEMQKNTVDLENLPSDEFLQDDAAGNIQYENNELLKQKMQAAKHAAAEEQIKALEEKAGIQIEAERLKIVTAAQAEAKTILEQAEREKAEILEQANDQAELIKLETEQQTALKVREEIFKRVEDCIKKVDDTLDEIQEHQNKYFESYEKELKYLSLQIAEKVLHTHIAENGTAIEDLVKDVISSIKNVDWISVDLSDRLVVLIHQLRKEFAANDGGRRIDINSKDLPIDTLIVKTNEGAIEASVPVQLENMKKYFKGLDEKEDRTY